LPDIAGPLDDEYLRNIGWGAVKQMPIGPRGTSYVRPGLFSAPGGVKLTWRTRKTPLLRIEVRYGYWYTFHVPLAMTFTVTVEEAAGEQVIVFDVTDFRDLRAR
jgi:hypothetical protein